MPNEKMTLSDLFINQQEQINKLGKVLDVLTKAKDTTVMSKWIIANAGESKTVPFQGIKSAYVDNTNNSNAFILKVDGELGRHYIPANSGVYVPLNNPQSIEFSGAGIAYIKFLNIDIPPSIISDAPTQVTINGSLPNLRINGGDISTTNPLPIETAVTKYQFINNLAVRDTSQHTPTTDPTVITTWDLTLLSGKKALFITSSLDQPITLSIVYGYAFTGGLRLSVTITIPAGTGVWINSLTTNCGFLADPLPFLALYAQATTPPTTGFLSAYGIEGSS